ncbi:M50 family metallopeptidase [Sporobolomyces koalae]|uniref:M50 family metallopeptidase n=1 Tax=Sporobolomyces koalae TaxID=500713 RepID=UPI0031820F70
MAPAYTIVDSMLDLAPPATTDSSTLTPDVSLEKADSPKLGFWRDFAESRKAIPEDVSHVHSWARSIGRDSVPDNLHKRSSLEPNSTQKVTLGVIGAYVVVIGILWNVPIIHWVLWPWKMLVVGFHEFSHAAAGLCTGAKIKSISLDPNEGGCTMMSKGVGWITLPAGYLGSSLIGAGLIFCGFDIVASKVASIVVGVFFLLTLWWARKDWLTILTILFAVGVIVGFWFIAHGAALRFYILFVGVMSSLYSIFDICDDLIFRKVNESDASVFAKRYGGSSQCWGVVWVIISLGFAACGIIAGLAVFKDTFSEQAQRGADFLPTRLFF